LEEVFEGLELSEVIFLVLEGEKCAVLNKIHDHVDVIILNKVIP
jgi:hypothetical protein